MLPEAIPPDLQQFVEQELASGAYATAEEILADGLRLLRDRKLRDLRQEINAGFEEIERGEGIELEGEEALRRFFEDIKAQGRQQLEAG